uniref:Zinc finger protein 148 n=1 Tax=Schistocephalus solidus TaxID=70667 RepID=A0A0X3QCK0_SCHSO
MDKGGTLMIQTDTAEPEDCQLANKIKPEESECFSTEALIECDEPEATGVLRPDEVEPKKEPKEPPVERPKRKSKLPRITQPKLFQCDQCRFRFLTYVELQVHFDYLHMGVRKCFECKVKFTKQNDMLMHMMRVHADDTKFLCDNCDDAFLSKEELDNHRRRCKTNISASQMKEARTPPVGLPLAATLLANATKSQRLQAPPSSTASTPVTRSRAKTASVVISPITTPPPPPPPPPTLRPLTCVDPELNPSRTARSTIRVWIFCTLPPHDIPSPQPSVQS